MMADVADTAPRPDPARSGTPDAASARVPDATDGRTDGTRTSAGAAGDGVRFGTARGRWLLVATILGSAMAGIDTTVVNVALPWIGREFSAPFATLQWTVSAYTLTLAALILVGGVLGDRYGRRRIFLVGVAWFALASMVCGLAPSAEVLVGARAVQGIGGALLTPGSLAILQSSFAAEDRARAVGAWSGLLGVATAVGPLLGGWMVDGIGWRWVFFLNLPVAVVVTLVTRRWVPESGGGGSVGAARGRRLDWPGAALGALALAGLTYALTEVGQGAASTAVLVAAAVAVLAAAAFAVREHRTADPMLPFAVFRSRQFSAVNAVTLVVYGGFGAVMLLLVVELQVVAGYPATAAGMAMLPATILMMLLSSRSGALAARIGPRLQLTVGPAIQALGIALMTRIHEGASYLTDVLPAVLVFGIGLSTMVAPLTATALAAAPDEHAGLASGVNNAVARTGNLLAVAAVPPLAGLAGRSYADPAVFDQGFGVAMWISAGTVLAGAVLAGLTIRNHTVAQSN